MKMFSFDNAILELLHLWQVHEADKIYVANARISRAFRRSHTIIFDIIVDIPSSAIYFK